MKNVSKLVLIFVVVVCSFLFTFNYSKAENTTDEQVSVSTSGSQEMTASTVKSGGEDWFSASNIINILLVTVGVVIILLAFAILSRIKNTK